MLCSLCEGLLSSSSEILYVILYGFIASVAHKGRGFTVFLREPPGLLTCRAVWPVCPFLHVTPLKWP